MGLRAYAPARWWPLCAFHVACRVPVPSPACTAVPEHVCGVNNVDRTAVPEHPYPSRGGVPQHPGLFVLCSAVGGVWFWSVWCVGVVVLCVSSGLLGFFSRCGSGCWPPSCCHTRTPGRVRHGERCLLESCCRPLAYLTATVPCGRLTWVQGTGPRFRPRCPSPAG